MVKKILSQPYLITVIAALLIGLFVSQATALIVWNTIILQIIFFLSCLKIEPQTVLSHLRDWKFLLLANFAMLLGFPLVVWALGIPWQSEFGFALFLLTAMPVGMTAPLLVDVANGKHSIAMVLTVTTSLLAPFTIPALTKILYGTQIAVDAPNMFKQLLLVILVPFILAMIVRGVWPKVVDAVKTKIKPVSIILLGLLIAEAVAKQSGPILEHASNLAEFTFTTITLFFFFFALHIVGYFVFWWKSRHTKQTASISLTYMNFTLAIFLANEFFPTPGILLPLVLAIIPWATFLPIWLRVSKNFK